MDWEIYYLKGRHGIDITVFLWSNFFFKSLK
jgi:hypothetical protein